MKSINNLAEAFDMLKSSDFIAYSLIGATSISIVQPIFKGLHEINTEVKEDFNETLKQFVGQNGFDLNSGEFLLTLWKVEDKTYIDLIKNAK